MIRPVLMLTSGGLEHGGGIGRMIGYLVEEAAKIRSPIVFKVVDTRGPGALVLWPRFFLRAIGAILEARPRQPILHIHIAGRGSTLRKIILVAFGRVLRLPIILHLHDYDYEAFCKSLPKPALSLIRWTFARAERVIVLGAAAKETVTGLLGVAASRVRILPNAVPAPSRVNSRDGETGPVKILFLGQLSRRKGVHDLIAALNQPVLADLNWIATLAGGGPHNDSFVRQAASTAMGRRIFMPGWLDREATTRLLEAADILILPSYAEGLAMSVLEGMAYGLCIICTPVGALADAIDDGVDGLLVRPGDIAGIAEALASCVRSPELRRRFGDAAAARFSKEFDIRLYPARLGDIYRDVGLNIG